MATSGYRITVGGTTVDLDELYESGIAVTVGDSNFKTGDTSGILTAAEPVRIINTISYTDFKSDQNPLTNHYTDPTGGIGSGAAAAVALDSTMVGLGGQGTITATVPPWAHGFSCYAVSARGAPGNKGPSNTKYNCPPPQAKRHRKGGDGGDGGLPAVAYTTSAIPIESGVNTVVVQGHSGGIRITHGNNIAIQANNGGQGLQGNSANSPCPSGNAGKKGGPGTNGNIDHQGATVSTLNQSNTNTNKPYKIHFLI